MSEEQFKVGVSEDRFLWNEGCHLYTRDLIKSVEHSRFEFVLVSHCKDNGVVFFLSNELYYLSHCVIRWLKMASKCNQHYFLMLV